MPFKSLFRFALACAALLNVTACDNSDNATSQSKDKNVSAKVISEAVCATCHADQTKAWQGSHHGKAMLLPSADTVLGDFSGKTLAHHSQSARFSVSDDVYTVHVTQAGKAEQSFQIDYVFGFDPLQQYLVKTEKGKLQVLPFAWDSRPKEKGGQRWFHIYPKENLPTGDRLHWQQPLQNWNGMCADCHSTGLKRQYEPDTDIFKTTFAAVNVSCASCHTGLSQHVGEQKPKDGTIVTTGKWKDDLTAYISRSEGHFTRKDGDPTVKWAGKPRNRPEMQVCASCHAIRSSLTDGIDPSKKFMDQFNPGLLTQGSYHADGQIQGEVYVWGSFQQSKMFQAGVTCSDCHDVHSTKLKIEGNGLCAQCHAPAVFDTPKHTKHPVGTEGAKCVSCHMPSTTYMEVDARRDHSFKIPRPDLSVTTNTPNACSRCHTDEKPDWAASKAKDLYGDLSRHKNTAPVFRRIWQGDVTARAGLLAIIEDQTIAPITRATALSISINVMDQSLLQAAIHKVKNPEPLIRMGAVTALSILPLEQKAPHLLPLLNDPLLAVRLAAVQQLLEIDLSSLTRDQVQAYNLAYDGLIKGAKINSWRGEGRSNMAIFYQRKGLMSAAQKALEQSIKIDRSFAPAYANLSEMIRQGGDEKAAQAVLKKGLVLSPKDASLHFALGLSFIRTKEMNTAMKHLNAAVNGTGAMPRYDYTYVVGLQNSGKAGRALFQLEQSLRKYPFDVQLLSLAFSWAQQSRDAKKVRSYARRLLDIYPNDAGLRQLAQ